MTAPVTSTAERGPAPAHHHAEEALVEYVAGTAPAGTALAFACHASLCAACARRLATLEAVGGALLEGGAHEAVPADALARALAALDAPGASDAAQASDEDEPALSPLPSFLDAYRLPRPMKRVLATLGQAVRWRLRLPGVRAIDVPLPPAVARGDGAPRVRLVAFQPGVTIPPHDHRGAEHIVIFTGAIEEQGRRFARGDIATREVGEQHEQRIADGETCVALVVNEGPLVPLTLRGRLLLLLARA
jgi:putative transcriptional regulator